MRIRKIHLDYRPIPDLSFEMEPKEFNLIYGPENGSGKTFILDCLTARIFGRGKRAKNSDIDGSLLIEEDGEPIEAKGDENIFETRHNLSWKTVKNIFFCREGDLEIEKKKYLWKTVQERLSEFANINQILEEVKEKTYHTKERLDWKQVQAKEKRKLEKSVETYSHLLNGDAYYILKDYYRAKRKNEKLKKVNAKKTYEKASKLLEELNNVRRKIEEECGPIGDVGETKVELNKRVGKLENKRESVQETNEMIKNEESNIEEEKKKESSLEKEKEKFSDYNYESFREKAESLKEIEERAKRETLLDRNTWITPSTFVLGILSVLMGIAFTPFLFLLGSLLAVPVYGLMEDRKRRGLEEKRGNLLEKLEVQLAPYLDEESEFSSTQEVQLALQRIRKETNTIDSNLDRANSAKKTLEETKQEHEESLRGKKGAETKASNALTDFLQEKGCEDVEELRKKLKKKKPLKKKINSIRSEIIGLLGERRKKGWESKMEEIKEEFKGDEENKYPKLYGNDLDELRKIWESNKELLDELSKKAKDHKKKILKQGVDSLTELLKKKKKNEERLKELKETHEAGDEVISILRDMLSSQKTLLLSTFTEGSDSITERFKEVTDARFSRVFLKEDKIVAETKSGKIISLHPGLSGGEKEILQILIRTTLGKKILGKKAFFFLDTPLLHADKRGRRKKAIQTLKKIMNEGWQIFYFTHDDYSRDIIREIIPSDKLEEKELELLKI